MPVNSVSTGVGLQISGQPATIAEAEKALLEIRERQENGEENDRTIDARYGSPDQAITKSLTRCLQVKAVLLNACCIRCSPPEELTSGSGLIMT